MPFFILIIKSLLSQGFSIYRYKPTSLIARIAFSLSAYPVNSILLTSGCIFFTSAKNSSPFISGIKKSEITKSGVFSDKYSNASFGLLKKCASEKPSTFNKVLKAEVTIFSSSTTTIFPLFIFLY